MTEAGWSDMTEEQWRKLGSWLADISQSEIAQKAGWISVQQCEYVLRAFCDEVEKRADSYYKHATPEARGFAFDHLRRELLGESTE